MAALVIAVVALRGRDDGGREDGADPAAGTPKLRTEPGHLPVPEVPPEVQVANVMQLWRTAIQSRDAESVLSCDQIFREQPAIFTQALVTSARTDSEDRVRAFSTRVLGKFKDPALVPIFRELLADKSPFVRGNAAWALGLLRSHDATAELERLKRADPDGKVRQAATQALAGGGEDEGGRPR